MLFRTFAVFYITLGASEGADVVSSASSSAPTYLCHACADAKGTFAGVHLTSSSPSTYQVDKAAKHTQVPTSFAGVVSVLNSHSTSEYDQFARQALDHGFVEVQGNGSFALIYPTTGYIGTRYQGGAATVQEGYFRWYLSSDPNLAHGRPDSSTNYLGAKCTQCGRAVTL